VYLYKEKKEDHAQKAKPQGAEEVVSK